METRGVILRRGEFNRQERGEMKERSSSPIQDRGREAPKLTEKTPPREEGGDISQLYEEAGGGGV